MDDFEGVEAIARRMRIILWMFTVWYALTWIGVHASMDLGPHRASYETEEEHTTAVGVAAPRRPPVPLSTPPCTPTTTRCCMPRPQRADPEVPPSGALRRTEEARAQRTPIH